MDKSSSISNQDLWKILTGHSCLRAPDVIEEVCSCSKRLCKGLGCYEPHSTSSVAKLKSSGKVKGRRLDFVSLVSRQLDLDADQSFSLFQSFLSGVYRGSLSEVNQQLVGEKQQLELLQEVRGHYYNERLQLLHCVRHILGYWQDGSHPYRDVYRRCLDAINEALLIDEVWKQYEKCTQRELPKILQNEQDESSWLLQNLREQCLLLEIVLLYYKDFVHPASSLLAKATLIQKLGFGCRQNSRVSLVPGTEPLITHINHLSSLILVEAVDLEYIKKFMLDDDGLLKHHLLAEDAESAVKELDVLVGEWGDMVCHAPFLLAWMVFKFTTKPTFDLEHYQLLGNRALQCGVFDYLSSILDSPYLSGDSPLPSLAKVLVHNLLSVCLSSFSEQSLGDVQTLVAIATKTLTHPRLRLEFWETDDGGGTGLLLSSSVSTHPSTLTLLTTLSAHPLTAVYVTRYLTHLPTLTEELTSRWPVVYDSTDTVQLTEAVQLYEQESRYLGVAPLVIPQWSHGRLLPAGEGQRSQLVSWNVVHSALDVFMFETCSLLHTTGVGVDTTPHPLVAKVTNITKLVTEILANDWSLYPHFRPITAQYFDLIQKFSPLPNPPAQLLAACVQCIATMATNNCTEIWERFVRTGFPPYISGPCSISLQSVPIASGHFGHVLNTWERSRGVYLVTMAMTDLLLAVYQSDVAMETSGLLGSVVYMLREVFSTCHSWRYKGRAGRNALVHKLLRLCHSIVLNQQQVQEKRSVVDDFVLHFLLHSVGHQILLGTLSLGVGVVNRLLSNHHNTSTPPIQVQSLKLTFELIDMLLQAKIGQELTPLEHALATQSIKQTTPTEGRGTKLVHLVSIIASYIHHHDDPHVPIGATKLLTRLSLVAPMSVFACLGQLATPIRDTYVTRLKSNVEDNQLKVAILELVLASVHSQPGMAELFISVRPGKSPDKRVVYSLEDESCLNAVLSIIKPSSQSIPCSLRVAAMALLAGLWEGRHDAALIALRGTKDFWTNITKPLSLESGSKEKNDLLVASHVMNIVAMETYYTVKQQMDKDLSKVLKELSSKDHYTVWINCLSHSNDKALIMGQLELTRSLSSLLLVVCSSTDTADHLSNPSLRVRILDNLLNVLESQLAASTNDVSIATELSILYLVLYRKWSCDLDRNHGNKALSTLSHILQLSVGMAPSICAQLNTHLYSLLTLLYQTARTNNECLEPRYSVGLIPFIAETMQSQHIYIALGSKCRPDVTAVYVLNEIVRSMTPDLWLHPLRHHALLMILVRTVDEHVTQHTNKEGVEAILVLFLTLAQTKQGAESLLLNSLNHTLCVSVSEIVSGLDRQLCEWREVWLTSLLVVTEMLRSLGHQFLTHALDFVGVYQERLAITLDVFHAINDLSSLRETAFVCQLFLALSKFKGQWQFSLPALFNSLLELLVSLATTVTALLNKRASLKHVIKTMNASGLLPAEIGPNAVAMTTKKRIGRSVSLDKSLVDDSLITSCPAFSQLQDGLVSILTSTLSALRHFSPDLDSMILDGVLDLVEFPPLFSLSLAPPTVDNTTPPSLGTLTTCLTTVLALLNRVDPAKINSPTSSLTSLSVPHTLAEKRGGLVCLLEQTVFILLSQTTRYLVDPGVDGREKQLLKKELASELGTFLNSLLINFSRKGIPSPGRATTPSRSHAHFQVSDSGSSGRVSSLTFTEEQGLFRLADSFVKQFFR